MVCKWINKLNYEVEFTVQQDDLLGLARASFAIILAFSS